MKFRGGDRVRSKDSRDGSGGGLGTVIGTSRKGKPIVYVRWDCSGITWRCLASFLEHANGLNIMLELL